MLNAKVVPWNYNSTMVTYKGKKIIEEVDEVVGLTYSGRCFTLEKLRKVKLGRDNQRLLKKLVTKNEAEEFLIKIKLPEYFVMEKLRKTPAQIFVLSLLIYQDEYRKAIMNI